MPSSSEAQRHLAQMGLAYKRGHTLKGVSKAGMQKVRQMAKMSESDLRDFARAVKGKG